MSYEGPTCPNCREGTPAYGVFGVPILCGACYCETTGYSPADLAEMDATSEDDYAERVERYRAEYVPKLIANPLVREYYAQKGYEWAEKSPE